MKITFLNHASFLLEIDDISLCVDPYIFGSAFNNGWNLLSEENHDEQLRKLTHIFFSHEHPDHFSIPFLKKIIPNKRKNITILYQETYDKRVKNFCQNLGYQFLELKDKKEFKISKHLNICCGKVPVYDSWINFKINKTNILNVNDCVLENPRLVYEIKKVLNRNIDVLFTQFSYASYIETEENRKILALKQLEKIKLIDNILCPKYIVPFASFIYFSHLENSYMNQQINNINNTYEFIKKECKAYPIILKPNQIWDTYTKIDNVSSLDYWKKFYDNIDELKYNSYEKSINKNALDYKCEKYLKRIKKNNNFTLIYFLKFINFFPKINICVSDLNKKYTFDLIDGLKNSDFNNKKNESITLHSSSLSFIFDYDYGFDTILVNARLKCDKNYFFKVKKCFILGPLNNIGHSLKFIEFYKFININFFIRCLEVIGIKKRKY